MNFHVDEESPNEECSHYNRGCLVECDKCAEYVNCRLCHEEMDRFKVRAIKCKECGILEQLPLTDLNCKECDNLLARYYCSVCNLFELDKEKSIFHCNECGICRKGVREDYFHCDKCNMCILVTTDQHNCFQNSFQAECVICGDELFDSVMGSSLLKCGHAMHQECLKEYVQHDYKCPICKKSVADMTEAWNRIRTQLQENQNPVAAHEVRVLCHDVNIILKVTNLFMDCTNVQSVTDSIVQNECIIPNSTSP